MTNDEIQKQTLETDKILESVGAKIIPFPMSRMQAYMRRRKFLLDRRKEANDLMMKHQADFQVTECKGSQCMVNFYRSAIEVIDKELQFHDTATFRFVGGGSA